MNQEEQATSPVFQRYSNAEKARFANQAVGTIRVFSTPHDDYVIINAADFDASIHKKDSDVPVADKKAKKVKKVEDEIKQEDTDPDAESFESVEPPTPKKSK